MAKKTYFRKLVRDKIPNIIRIKHNKEPHIRILDQEEYHAELRKKLHEEVAEYCKDQTAEEIADILEVVYSLAQNVHKLSQENIETIRQQKANCCGCFANKLYLEYID